MQQTRKTSFLKTLFGGSRRTSIERKKTVQPLDERQLAQVVGGISESGSPKGGWQ
ncbi:MAG TPA: hypothetical protein VIY30_17790 [Burkholderiaceae bacterium]